MRDAGLRTALWVVLTHNSALGSENPDRTVRNCFGEHYAWALCPAHEDVREYAATLAAESVRDLRPDTVILESCGQMGAVHQHMHEKTDAVWAPAVARLLSICCCAACTAAWQRAGLDPERIVEQLREQVRAIMATGDLGATADGLPEEISATLLRIRQQHTDALRAAVLAEVGSAGRVHPARQQRSLGHRRAARPDPGCRGRHRRGRAAGLAGRSRLARRGARQPGPRCRTP